MQWLTQHTALFRSHGSSPPSTCTALPRARVRLSPFSRVNARRRTFS